MNVLKSKTTALLFFLAVLFTQSIFAQRGHHRDGFSAELQNEIGLSDAQKEKVGAIKADFKEKFQALKKEETGDHSAKRAAMKNLMQAQRAAISEVLTEEQQVLLKEKRSEKMAERKERFSKVDKKGLKSALATYRDENVKPVLLAQRAKLEKELSQEDKAKIAELRMAFETKKTARKAMHKDRKKAGQKRNQELRKAKKEAVHNDEDKQALKSMVEKYETSIDELYTEIAPQQSKWKEDQKAIIEKHKSSVKEDKPEGRRHDLKKGKHGKKGHRHHHKGQAMKKGTFLLLDPK